MEMGTLDVCGFCFNVVDISKTWNFALKFLFLRRFESDRLLFYQKLTFLWF